MELSPRARLLVPIPKLEDELRRELRARLAGKGDGDAAAGSVPSETKPFLIRTADAIDPRLYWVRADYGPGSFHAFTSIGNAVEALRALSRERGGRPGHVSLEHHRRGELIAETFRPPRMRAKDSAPIAFPTAPSPARATTSTRAESVGVAMPSPRAALPFSLTDANTLWVAERPTPEPFTGVYEFAEDREEPPSRAYLKLWEVFTRLGRVPAPGDRAIDLGSAPGGWTWVLSRFCEKTYSIDGAAITPELAADPRVDFRRGDAFRASPESFGPLEWICSDMICAPERLLELVQAWLPAHPRATFVCTLKMKGPSDPKTIDAFARIPDAKVLHLHQNKHELTFLRVP